MRVAFGILGPKGGAWKRLQEFCSAASKYDVETTVYVPAERNWVWSRNGSIGQVIEVSSDVLGPMGRYVPLSVRFAWAWTKELVRSDGVEYDIVGGFAGLAGLGPVVGRHILGQDYAVVNVLRGGEGRGLDLHLEARGLSPLYRRIRVFIQRIAMSIVIAGSDKVIAQSKQGLGELKEECLFGFSASSTWVWNNVNSPLVIERANPKEEWQYEVGRPCEIAFVGRLSKLVKGLDTLLEACDFASDQGISLRLHVAGDGPDSVWIKKMAANRDWLVYHGWVRDACSLMRDVDLVVVPSRYDPFPNTVLEALWVRTPVLAACVDGIPEMLGHGELLFNPKDPKELAEMLSNFAETYTYRERVIEVSRQRRRALRFDWDEKIVEAIVC